jgi:magnesium transporter
VFSITLFRKGHPPVGARPGTLAIPANAARPTLDIIHYSPTDHRVHQGAGVAAIPPLLRDGTVTWVDVEGLGDEKLLRDLGEMFHIHPLALEDVANAPQRPKAEEYDEHLLLVARMARLTEEMELDIEQVAMFVGPNYVLSFGERPGDVLDPVRNRIREGKGAIRGAGPGYLAYAILDCIIDAYYPIIERLSAKLERLEDRVLVAPTPRLLDHLNRIKTDLVLLRRGVWPQLETLNRLLREPNQYLGEEVQVYLRDPTDHCAQLIDVIDSHRELINGLLNTYLSVVSNRTNEVMKVLTIMSAIFIPLTFLAGIYGMNFEFMPELHKEWSYPILLGLMAAIALGLMYYFWRKGWIGNGPGGGRDDDDG